MSDEHPHVQLGEHSLPVYGQRWRRVVKRLGSMLDVFRSAADESGEFDGQEMLGLLGNRTYYALCTFIPNLPDRMPEYEFNGYGSREAFDDGDYDENLDKSPTFPQLLDAFDVIIEVNGGKRLLKMLGEVFDPQLLKAEAGLALSEWREKSTGLPSSPGASGESDPRSSTPTDPTAESRSTSLEAELPDFVPGPWTMSSGEPLTTSA